MIKVKLEVLTLEEANKKRLKEEEQRFYRERVVAEDHLMHDKVAQLRIFLINHK